MNTNYRERNGARRVMLVDDDCAVRLSVRQIFVRDDHFAVVSEHARATDALKHLTEMPGGQLPDMVLLDISMPGMDGIACCHELRELFPKLVIAMFTARKLAAYADAARGAGADAYFCKSMDLPALAEELAGLRRSKCISVGPDVLIGGATGGTVMHHDPHLSPRQEEILELVAQGFAVKEIADHFHVSDTAVYKLKHDALERIVAARQP